MPDKPVWYANLEDAISRLETLETLWVDRATLQAILGVGRRRAQQILQPLIRRTIGRNGLADRAELVAHLRSLAGGRPATIEKDRRERLHAILDELHRQSREQPRILVEAPVSVVNQAFDDLPAGLRLDPGRIVVEGFRTPEEAKQRLLALVMAIGNDPDGFDRRIAVL